jgi:hypothetical protein
MAHPLENYRTIANKNYISKIEGRFYTEYVSELEKGLYVDIDKENKRLLVSGHDMYTNEGFSSHITFSSYFIEEYNKLEKEVRLRIDENVLTYLDLKKQETFIKGIVAELQVLQTSIEKKKLSTKSEVYKPILIDKVSHLIQTLTEIHLTSERLSTPKIQWLGKTNVLATLIYDLWKGQDKVKRASTKPMIQAEKKDLEQLLLNNFIDSKGKPLTISTISDYLNTNKDKAVKRARIGVRIELEY